MLEGFELWDDALALSQTMYLAASDEPADETKRVRLLGLAHSHRGELSLLADRLLDLDAIAAKLEDKVQKEAADEEKKARDAKKSDADITKAKDEKLKQSRNALKPVEHAQAELRGLILLANNDAAKAAEEFAKATDIPKLRLASYQLLSGQPDKSLETVKAATKDSDNQVLPIAAQVDLLRRLNKLDDAKAAFTKLRDVASAADLNAPPLARLAAFAQELGWPTDWRNPVVPSKDVGERPTLDSLGPFRWSPSQAADWSVPQPGDKTLSLADYRGRSVVVIFYLGAGCLHCVEQLQKFAPRVSEFDKAGLSVVAISTETLPSLATAVANFSKDGQFAIPLASDPEMKVFRSYRAYDDFEKQPLHGTFLIDAAGFVRWHDISAEPFMDVEFVLSEAKRLKVSGQ